VSISHRSDATQRRSLKKATARIMDYPVLDLFDPSVEPTDHVNCEEEQDLLCKCSVCHARFFHATKKRGRAAFGGGAPEFLCRMYSLYLRFFFTFINSSHLFLLFTTFVCFQTFTRGISPIRPIVEYQLASAVSPTRTSAAKIVLCYLQA